MSEQRLDDPSGDRGADPYRFDGLPLEPIPAGRNVIVAGAPHVGARALALRMVVGSLADDDQLAPLVDRVRET